MVRHVLSALDRLASASRLLILLIIVVAGCGPEEQENRIIRSPVVPFDELFTVADTVRLDPSVIIGSVGFLDVNAQGEFLVSDHVGRGLHRFSPSGSHVRSYSVPDCLPDEANFIPMSSRLLRNGGIMTMKVGGAAVIFDANGNCVEATRRFEAFSRAFCEYQGSIYVHRVYVEGKATMGVYSPALEAIDDLEIEPPRLVRLNQFNAGLMGTGVACFADGPYYVYPESMDGMPAPIGSSITQYQPEFFEIRPDDLSKEADVSERSRQSRDYPSTVSIFALDGSTRMVVTTGLDDKWRLDSSEATSSLGLSIASNTGRFPGRSTISPIPPRAAGNGYFYAAGDNEQLPNGDYGNPVIIRYRFIQPGNTGK